MAIIYNRYVNSEDHTWYDSTNVVYSLCYDNSEIAKTLKIVFKQGKTYLYKDVDVNDYLMFKNAESSGSGANQYIIKKYKPLRLQDTDLTELEKLKEDFINDGKITEEAFTNLVYSIEYDNDSGDFSLQLNGKEIYHGCEGSVSIINLFRSMNIKFSMIEYSKSENDRNAKNNNLECKIIDE